MPLYIHDYTVYYTIIVILESFLINTGYWPIEFISSSASYRKTSEPDIDQYRHTLQWCREPVFAKGNGRNKVKNCPNWPYETVPHPMPAQSLPKPAQIPPTKCESRHFCVKHVVNKSRERSS